MIRSIWKSSILNTNLRIRIFKSNVLSVLLYGSECWKTTKARERKLDVFQTKCLRRILRIFWPNTIRNEELLNRTGLDPITETIRIRRWRWLGHVCRMPQDPTRKQKQRKTQRNLETHHRKSLGAWPCNLHPEQLPTETTGVPLLSTQAPSVQRIECEWVSDDVIT